MKRFVIPLETAYSLHAINSRVVRPYKGKARLSTAYAHDNREWLKGVLGAGCQVAWAGSHWDFASQHAHKVARAQAIRHGWCLYVHAEMGDGERCDTRCLDALPESVDECVCKGCYGVWHGTNNPAWREGSGTFLYTPGELGYYAEMWGRPPRQVRETLELSSNELIKEST